MSVEDFRRYSGPFDLEIDCLCRIADSLDEFRCTIILSYYDIELVRVIELEDDGGRKPYVDPLYFFCERGKEATSPRRLHRLGTVVKICELLDSGILDKASAFDYGVDTKSEEDTEPDGGDDQSDTGEEQPGENQEQGAADQP